MITALSLFTIDNFLKLVIVLIMFSVGLSLKLSDIGYVIRHQRLLLIGLSLKMLVLPLWGFLIMEPLSIPELWKLGTMIVLFCPGGTTSNVITYWFNGTPALTIFLTTLSGLIAIFLLPFLVNRTSIHYFGEGTTFYLPIWSTVGTIIFLIIFPTLLGLALRKYRSMLALEIERYLKPTSVLLLGLVFILKLFFEESDTSTGISWKEIMVLFPLLFLINVGGIIIGYWLPSLFKLNQKDRLTIGVEMGVQNVGLALLIGGVLLGNVELIKPALIYVLFTFWTTAAFAFLINRLVFKKGINTD